MAIPSYITFDGSPAPPPKTSLKTMNEEAQLASPSLCGDTLLVITVPAAQASLEFFDCTKLLPDPGFAPVRNILPLTLPRLVHPEFLSLLKCSLLKEISVCHILVSLCPCPPWPALGTVCITISCEFLTYHSKISNNKEIVQLYNYI